MIRAVSIFRTDSDSIESGRFLTVRGGPWPDSDVSNTQMITNEISGRIVCKGVIHDAVETACFVDVTV